MDVPRDVIDVLLAGREPVILGHTNPDVDALGAMLGLGRALRTAHAAVHFGGRHAPRRLQFMIDLAGLPLADEARIAAADVVVILDTAGTNRINVAGGYPSLKDKIVVNIDHHLTNTDYGAVNWVEDDASSTSEMICHLITAAGWPMSAATATLLYAGIHADTCGFSLPTVRPDTFDAAAVLARAGADFDLVGSRLYRSQDPHHFDLLRRVYHNTRTGPHPQIAYSTLNWDELQESGCGPEDIDDQVSIPRSLSGMRIAMLLSEAEPGVVRVNLRGEGGTPVLALAVSLGGGGHEYSAGVRVRGRFDEVVQRVLEQAATYLNGLTSRTDGHAKH